MTRSVMEQAARWTRSVRDASGWIALVGVALVGAVTLLLASPREALAAPQVTNPAVETGDPASITFKVRATADADIASAVVNYTVLSPDQPVKGSLRAEVGGGRTVDAAATMQMNGSERYIPVGTQITYSWTITDKNGATFTSPESTFTFLDGRFQWQSKKVGQVTVYWYGDGAASADLALRSTAESITFNEALLKVKLPYDIRVVVWRNSADAKAAQRPRAATFDQQVITGGSRVSDDVLHIYDPLGGFEDVARHEAAHIVTKVAGDGKIAQLPSWIDEGTAVYAQKSPGGYAPAVARAVQSNQTLRLKNMAAPANQAGLVDLFYGQSWATVKFMIDTYGKDKFAGVFKAVKDGTPIDGALKANIGLDQDGLYNAWRKSVGLQTIEFPPEAPVAGIAKATQPPLGIPTSVNSAESTEGQGGAASSAPGAAVDTTTAVGVGVGALVVAAGLGFFALRLSRRKAA